MARELKCTFKRVNGDKTGVFCRTGPSKDYPSPGILYMVRCPDAKSFRVDPTPAGNSYYKLLRPTEYGLPNSTMYVYLDDSFILSQQIIDTAEPVKQVEYTTQTTPVPSSTQTTQPRSYVETTDYNGRNAVEGYDTGNVDTNVWGSGQGITTAESATIQQTTNPVRRENYLNNYDFLDKALKAVHNNINIPTARSSVVELKHSYMTRYNRFRIGFADDQLTKTFAHVFFTRPDLNIFEPGSDYNLVLNSQTSVDPLFTYLYETDVNILASLTRRLSTKHDFNFFLSSKSGSFELNDEELTTVEHGETYTGHKLKYGKHTIASRTAGSFSINFTDDDDLRVYKMHRAWVEYIAKVYRGVFKPHNEYARNRILDYPVSAYYFLCGADGETVIYWSKYTGVFPSSVPNSTLSWTKGNVLNMPEYSIQYQYSWKEDFNPLSLAEFNLNSKNYRSYKYLKTYEPTLLTTGKTFTGAPFVETQIGNDGSYEFKLRFRAE